MPQHPIFLTLLLALPALKAVSQTNPTTAGERSPYVMTISTGMTASTWVTSKDARHPDYDYLPGTFVAFNIVLKHTGVLGVETGLELVDKGNKEAYDGDQINLRYLSVPAGFSFFLFNDFLAIRTGLYAAVVTARKGKFSDLKQAKNIPATDFGFNAAVNMALIRREKLTFGLTGSYAAGFRNIFNYGSQSLGGIVTNVPFRNKSLGFGLFVAGAL